MLYIAKWPDEGKDEGEILFKKDAWCVIPGEAEAFIASHNLTVLKDEITLMGDRIIWVR